MAILISFFAGRGYTRFRLQLGNLEEEYGTKAVISDVQEYVTKHDEWPTCWSDLGTEQELRDSVEVNWKIDISTADRYDVMMSIKPATKFFMTYPHAERDLHSLYEAVSKLRENLKAKPQQD